MKRLAALVGLCAASLAAHAQIPHSTTDFGPVVKWSTVAQGNSSGIETPEWRVITNEADWRRHFRRMYPEVNNPRAVPDVADWNREMIVAIHLGARNSGGYGVYVETIRRVRTGQFDIAAVVQEPPRGSFNTQAITHPWVVIRVERTVGTPTLSFRTSSAGIMYLPNDNCWHGRPGRGETPLWRVGAGGQLIPLNDAARRALGQDPVNPPKDPKGDKKGGKDN